MKVNGNLKPKEVQVEMCSDGVNAIVYLRENIEEVEKGSGEDMIKYFEYDEYQIIAKYYAKLEKDVKANKEYWFETGRSLEA